MYETFNWTFIVKILTNDFEKKLLLLDNYISKVTLKCQALTIKIFIRNKL